MKQTLIALALSIPLIACSEPPKEAPVYGTYSGGSFQQTPPEEEIEQKLSDAQTQSSLQEDDGYGSEIAAGVAGAAVGALAMNALSNNNRSSGYEVERCDSDDHPNEPECRGTAKYYKWKKEQDMKKKAAADKQRKSSSYSKTYRVKRKPR